jgi:hypothetical protein
MNRSIMKEAGRGSAAPRLLSGKTFIVIPAKAGISFLIARKPIKFTSKFSLRALCVFTFASSA